VAYFYIVFLFIRKDARTWELFSSNLETCTAQFCAVKLTLKKYGVHLNQKTARTNSRRAYLLMSFKGAYANLKESAEHSTVFKGVNHYYIGAT